MPNISLYFVRHGERIDQVDSSWAETSPCPQDPPLTTRGKMQARQTGRMIRDFAQESRSFSTPASLDSVNKRIADKSGTPSAVSNEDEQQQDWTTLQRITPPESPDLGRFNPMSSQGPNKHGVSTGDQKRQHHFAIVTSPFLRCSQTAIEIAIGMRTASAETSGSDGNCSKSTKWLSSEYVSGPVPDSIIVQRMQDFAMARRDHEQYYSIDWKYLAKDRQLPTWPETRESMQERLDRTLDHILKSYTSNDKSAERDLSIVFVTHASPVNALMEACLQFPTLVPVPNCSISRCQWTPLSTSNPDEDSSQQEPGMFDVLMQSTHTVTVAGEEGRWLLDYQTYTAHLDRDYRR
ncbi:hypothetical protein BGX21_007734 [Mortierella sp. AD011]|nr:hypothetical protein BGX20_008240 [Mortierella sp. AD010]KAF9402989.1 hypothetical protein BGX21_007734 [Mortierella sp. AD011]